MKNETNSILCYRIMFDQGVEQNPGPTVDAVKDDILNVANHVDAIIYAADEQLSHGNGCKFRPFCIGQNKIIG